MAKTIVLAVDVAGLVAETAERYSLDLPSKIVMFHYDDVADTLYVHFEYPSESVDSKIVDKHGEIILGLDQDDSVVSMTIINASTHKVPKE